MESGKNHRLQEAAYQCLPGGPLDIEKSFYERVASAVRISEHGGWDQFHLSIWDKSTCQILFFQYGLDVLGMSKQVRYVASAHLKDLRYILPRNKVYDNEALLKGGRFEYLECPQSKGENVGCSYSPTTACTLIRV